MPPFVYPEYRNPYVANIVDLMQQAGAAQAAGVRQAGEAIGQGQRQAGDIYGQFFGGLGQIPQQLAAQQYRSAQIANMQQEMALRKAEADRLDRTARVQAEASDAYRQSIDPETGLVDPKKVQAL